MFPRSLLFWNKYTLLMFFKSDMHIDETEASCSTIAIQEDNDINKKDKENNFNERLKYDPSASIFQNFGEVVCVGATAIIIILLLCILLFFEFKDHGDDDV